MLTYADACKVRRMHIGDSSPAIVNAIVRAPRNSNCKYSVLPQVGLLKLEKVLHSAVVYVCWRMLTYACVC